MKMLINEFAKLTGVSVRTLHYYDEIGLLKPALVEAQNGYRFYDENSLLRMQEILFYRELDFPLKSILEILSSPDYNKQKALAEQRKLLELKKERLERIIDALYSAEKGKITMSAFDNSDYESARKQYEVEAKRRWGETDQYKEYAEKTANHSAGKKQETNTGLMDVFVKFSECKKSGFAPDSDKAKALVEELKDYITQNYYTCTDQMLGVLGQMYVEDERFKNNIDKNGVGTAAFVFGAIESYIKGI